MANFKDTIAVTNAGYNGNNTADLLQRLDHDVLSKKPEVVILMIGTNDMLNLRNKLTVKEYRKNYQQLISKIKKHARLFLMTIPPVNEPYILQREDPEVYKSCGPQALVDSANTVIKELAKKNSCPLIDIHAVLMGCGGSTTDRRSVFQNEGNSHIPDGVHPTANGYRIIGAVVFEAITAMCPGTTRIVCFGDSITFGYRMRGAGGVTGDSYPAVLYRMMKEASGTKKERKIR
jgi:lysophospholipase L1-like esterase